MAGLGRLDFWIGLICLWERNRILGYWTPGRCFRSGQGRGSPLQAVKGRKQRLGIHSFHRQDRPRSLVNRIGERPHRIRAIRTLGYDLVISAEDAFSLRQMNATDGFLDRFAVVVIWDGSQASLP